MVLCKIIIAYSYWRWTTWFRQCTLYERKTFKIIFEHYILKSMPIFPNHCPLNTFNCIQNWKTGNLVAYIWRNTITLPHTVPGCWSWAVDFWRTWTRDPTPARAAVCNILIINYGVCMHVPALVHVCMMQRWCCCNIKCHHSARQHCYQWFILLMDYCHAIMISLTYLNYENWELRQ